jgi:hypothetical protein
MFSSQKPQIIPRDPRLLYFSVLRVGIISIYFVYSSNIIYYNEADRVIIIVVDQNDRSKLTDPTAEEISSIKQYYEKQ